MHVQPILPPLHAIESFSLLPDSVRSQLLFTWTAECVNGVIRSGFDLDIFIPTLEELLLTVEGLNFGTFFLLY